jgi:hypothetical protein
MACVPTERLGAVVDDLAAISHRHGFSIPRRVTISINDPDNLRDRTAPALLRHMTAKGGDKQPFFATHIYAGNLASLVSLPALRHKFTSRARRFVLQSREGSGCALL